MKTEDINKLSNIGITIDDVHYKYDRTSKFGFTSDTLTFTVKGSIDVDISDNVSMYIESLIAVLNAHNSKSEAVHNLLEQLKATAELTKE